VLCGAGLKGAAALGEPQRRKDHRERSDRGPQRAVGAERSWGFGGVHCGFFDDRLYPSDWALAVSVTDIDWIRPSRRTDREHVFVLSRDPTI